MIEYLLDIIAFVIGAVIGLKFSYKQHSEPYVVVNKVDAIQLIIAVVGFLLIVISNNMILTAVGCFIVGALIGERPGYGRLELVFGFSFAVIIYLLLKLSNMM